MNMIFYFWLKEKPYIEFVSHSATCARDFGTKNFVENSTNDAIGPANRIRIIIYMETPEGRESELMIQMKEIRKSASSTFN